jgi:hypothetical protein
VEKGVFSSVFDFKAICLAKRLNLGRALEASLMTGRWKRAILDITRASRLSAGSSVVGSRNDDIKVNWSRSEVQVVDLRV